MRQAGVIAAAPALPPDVITSPRTMHWRQLGGTIAERFPTH
jgi:hypothetical protein